LIDWHRDAHELEPLVGGSTVAGISGRSEKKLGAGAGTHDAERGRAGMTPDSPKQQKTQRK
jgi:hypothetical protein